MKNKIIGIICALNDEADALIAYMTDKNEETILGLKYTNGLLYGRNVVVSVCGAGKVAAAISTQTMLLKYGPELVINSGVAGALSEELSVFDIVIATDVIQYDFDTSACGDPVGLITAVGEREMECDKSTSDALFKSACKLGFTSVRGRIATGDRFISGKEEILRVKAISDAVACEMEGGAVAQTCIMAGGLSFHGQRREGCERGIPFCIVRSISDSGNGIEFGKFVKEAAKRSAAVISDYLNCI